MNNSPKLTLLRAGVVTGDRLDVDSLKPLFHVHVPKCGGTTLDEILFGMAKVRNRPYVRIPGTIYNQKFAGLGKTEALDEVKNLDFPGDWLFASGHIPCGKSPNHGLEINEVAMIREPSARVLSMYRMGIRRGVWTATTPIGKIFEAGLLVEDSMVRQFAGESSATTKLTEDHVELALKNFEAIKYKGLLDDFDSVVCSVLGDYGIPYVAFHRFQAGETLSDSGPSKLASEFEPYITLDQVFFRRALDLMNRTSNRSMEVTVGEVPPDAPVLLVTPYLFNRGQQIRSVCIEMEKIGNFIARGTANMADFKMDLLRSLNG